jgi:type IV pilus assembly protein PilY1
MKKLNFGKIAVLILSLSSTPAWTDDTEIFFGAPPAEDEAPPFIMLSLDWRSNLGSNICTFHTDPDQTDCDNGSELGDEIYGALVDEGRLGNGDVVTLFDVLRGVLIVVFEEIEDDGFSIGFMMSHENENNCTATNGDLNNDKGCSDGGYILRGFDVVDGSAAGQASEQELLDILANIPVPQGNLAHPYQGRELFFEFYRYLTGGDVLNGHKGWSDFDSDKTQGKGHYNLDQEYASGTGGGSATSGNGNCDFDTDRGCENTALPNNVDPNENSDGVISPWTTWDMDIDDGDKYTSPYTDGDYSCSKTYTINFLFQVSQQDADWNTEISKNIGNGNNEQGLELANISGNNAFPEIISKLHSLDHASDDVGVSIEGNQNVISYFIVDQVNTKTRAYAEAGGTEAPIDASENPELLLEALRKIFRDIASVSTTFTAASVPVNVQNRTEALPDMYLALFKVDENGYPFWPGNVKKLQIESEVLDDGSTAVTVVDSLGTAAFNPSTGRISDSALTYWTDSTALDVLTADPDASSDNSGRDGSSITRGGAGHRVPGYRVDSGGTPVTSDPTVANTSPSVAGDSDGRQLFVSPATVNGKSSTANALIPLDADSVTAGSLAADAEIQKLLGVLIEDADNPGSYINDADYIADIESDAGEDFSGLTDAESRAASAQILLKWVRGIDVFDWDGDTEYDDVRPWIMGDPLHSRPLTLNYGPLDSYDDDNQHLRILFGSSDGVLHSIRNTLANGDESGVEEWGFMPRELLANVKALTNRSFVGDDKPYGIDLPPVSFVIDNDHDGIIERGSGGNDSSCTPGGDDQSDPTDLNCDKAYVYVGLRRGGKSYYALDVSAPEDEPRLLWQITNEGAGTDFEELGMSFSTPRQAWVRFETDGTLNTYNGENVPVPVLIFGGGLYGGWTEDRSGRVGRDDLSYDVTTDAVDGHDPEGAAFFIVHARTGELLWKATWGLSEGGVSANEYHHDELIHSIPAAVTPIDSDGNGITDRLYVGDTGGNVWRFELPEYNPAVDASDTNYHNNFREDYWRATKLAELGGSMGSANDRRFYHGLSIIQGRDSIGRYDGIAIGSGDRTHPQSAPSTIDNKFFFIKDRIVYADDDLTASTGVDGRTPWVLNDLFDVTASCINDSNSDTDTNNQCSAADLANGWRLDLEETGEKNLSIPLISGGNVNFTTYLPEGGEAEGDCAPNIGISRLYQVAVKDGSPDIHLHSHLQGDILQASDRYVDLASGIDGGVTAIAPSTGLAGGTQTQLGVQRPNTFFWREINIDVLDKP